MTGTFEVFDAFSSLKDQTLALDPLQRTHLIRKSSAERGKQIFYIHRLIQDAARRRWTSDEWQVTFSRVVFCMSHVYPHQDKGQSMMKDYGVCIQYNAHMLSLLGHFIDNRDKILPSIEFAEILAHCGWYHYERGQLATAHKILTTAKSICDQVVGDK